MKKIGIVSIGLMTAGFVFAGPAVQDSPKVQSVQSVMDHVRPEPGLPIRTFVQGRKMTVNLVSTSSPLKAHYHASHEEAIYILKGHGSLILGDKVQKVSEGDIIFIPRKTLHSFTPEGGECRMLSVFSPAFDGRDRIFLKDDKQ